MSVPEDRMKVDRNYRVVGPGFDVTVPADEVIKDGRSVELRKDGRIVLISPDVTLVVEA